MGTRRKNKARPHGRSDHYHRRARAEGHAARSVYKLQELDRRAGILRAGLTVLDLGCAPGSWLRWAAARVGAAGRVVGLDRHPLPDPPPPNSVALVGDVETITAEDLRAENEGDAPFDVVLSDMAPDTTGIGHVDAARSVRLAERALELATELLSTGGTLLLKVFQGEDLEPLLKVVRARFERVTIEKPAASRRRSRELYVLAMGKRGP